MRTFEDHFMEYLKGSAVKKEIVDAFLDPKERTWAQFDPELGYVLGNSLPRDGMDNSSTISTSIKGMRTPHNYVNMPCRINTYGNSFTQCHQVSDGETWQEYLSAHLGEPIKNFGMGGFGVYQAYRRMLRTEKSSEGTENVILYIWGDDHHRSIMRCRHAAIYPWFNCNNNHIFHANFWSNIEMDMTSGKLVEKENICPTPESLYNMCDAGFMYETLKDDLIIQLCYCQSNNLDKDVIMQVKDFKKLAEILNVPMKYGSNDEARESIDRLCNKYAFAATKYILEKSRAFIEKNNKKMLVALFDPYGATKQLIQTGKRSDQEIVDFLKDNQYNYFDMNLVHTEDFKCFNLKLDDYYKRYFIGHYNPSGNHLFAFAIKDRIIEMLDTKPITYRNDKDAVIDFEGYLKYN